jgi:hypothetical protein
MSGLPDDLIVSTKGYAELTNMIVPRLGLSGAEIANGRKFLHPRARLFRQPPRSILVSSQLPI